MDSVESRSRFGPKFLSYDPGVLPTRPAPIPGEQLLLKVAGLPPVKTVWRSIRNQNHPQHHCFQKLRTTATHGMAGRAWYGGPVALDLKIFAIAPMDRWVLNDYVGGVMDTLDGSSGCTFTYLPIAFEDDCQVCKVRSSWHKGKVISYSLLIRFC
jgi:hypothetical protein